MTLYAWSPATDTTEIASVFRGRPLAEQPTVELLLPIRPPVTTTYFVPRARARRWWQRLQRSPFAHDVRAAVNAAFWPAVFGGAVIVGLALVVLTRGSYLSWDGAHEIPTAVTR